MSVIIVEFLLLKLFLQADLTKRKRIMSNWFECKAKFQKTIADGESKIVSEVYLVDALSFTEAEARVNKELEPFISGEFHVTNIKIAKLMDLIPFEGGDRWYRCKVAFIRIDEEKGIERRSNSYILVQASNLKEAYELLDKDLNTTMNDYEISGIQESPIMDVFPFFQNDDEGTVSDANEGEQTGPSDPDEVQDISSTNPD